MSWPRFGGAFPCRFLLQDRPTENRGIPGIPSATENSMQHGCNTPLAGCSRCVRLAINPSNLLASNQRVPDDSQRTTHYLGIVRLTERELADQKRSRLSRGELMPFSERGSAVLLEDITAV